MPARSSHSGKSGPKDSLGGENIDHPTKGTKVIIKNLERGLTYVFDRFTRWCIRVRSLAQRTPCSSIFPLSNGPWDAVLPLHDAHFRLKSDNRINRMEIEVIYYSDQAGCKLRKKSTTALANLNELLGKTVDKNSSNSCCTIP